MARGNFNPFAAGNGNGVSGKRIPVCLVLDASGSMSGSPINELNRGVKMFFDEIKADPKLRDLADVAIVTFGDSGSSGRVARDFGPIGNDMPPSISAVGGTPMGAGVTQALNILDQRKNYYRSNAYEYVQPILILMTDGGPTDSVTSAQHECVARENEKKLTVLAVGIGSGYSASTLRGFTSEPDVRVVGLNGLKFTNFFRWLAQSMSATGGVTGDGTDDWS